jgi:hypothetical protein
MQLKCAKADQISADCALSGLFIVGFLALTGIVLLIAGILSISH